MTTFDYFFDSFRYTIEKDCKLEQFLENMTCRNTIIMHTVDIKDKNHYVRNEVKANIAYSILDYYNN